MNDTYSGIRCMKCSATFATIADSMNHDHMQSMTPAEKTYQQMFFTPDGEYRPDIIQASYWMAEENADLSAHEEGFAVRSDRWFMFVIIGYDSLEDMRAREGDES